MGLSESAAEFFPEAAWQRCTVHWYRNVFSHVPSTKVRQIATMLKAIHAVEDIAAARQKAVQVIEKLRGLRLTTAAQRSRRRWPTTPSPRNIGGACAPTIRWLPEQSRAHASPQSRPSPSFSAEPALGPCE
jgi:hypothetical protein